MKKIIVFVAGKYSGEEERCTEKAEEVSVKLIRKGFAVITPHKNTQGYEKYEDDELGYEVWTRMYRVILERCDIIYVLSSWKDSKGTKIEIKHAIKCGIPVVCEDGSPTMIKHCSDLEVIHSLPSIKILEEIAKESKA